MNSSPVIIEKAVPAQFSEAQVFYATMDYDYPISPDSIVLIARDGQRICAVVRVSPEDHYQVLRGFIVHPDYQRQGLGTLMLRELEKHMGRDECFCLPHQWLEGFYGQINFEKILPKSLPPALYKHWEDLKCGPFPHVIAMQRGSNREDEK